MQPPYVTDLPSLFSPGPSPQTPTPPFAYGVSIYYKSVTPYTSLFTLCLVASSLVDNNSIASFVSWPPLLSSVLLLMLMLMLLVTSPHATAAFQRAC